MPTYLDENGLATLWGKIRGSMVGKRVTMVFDESTTFTVPNNISGGTIDVIMCGGGGGAGVYKRYEGSYFWNTSYSGGGSGYIAKQTISVSAGDILTIALGAAGTNATPESHSSSASDQYNNGTAGGASTLSKNGTVLMTANGGGPGTYNTSTSGLCGGNGNAGGGGAVSTQNYRASNGGNGSTYGGGGGGYGTGAGGNGGTYGGGGGGGIQGLGGTGGTYGGNGGSGVSSSSPHVFGYPGKPFMGNPVEAYPLTFSGDMIGAPGGHDPGGGMTGDGGGYGGGGCGGRGGCGHTGNAGFGGGGYGSNGGDLLISNYSFNAGTGGGGYGGNGGPSGGWTSTGEGGSYYHYAGGGGGLFCDAGGQYQRRYFTRMQGYLENQPRGGVGAGCEVIVASDGSVNRPGLGYAGPGRCIMSFLVA